MVVERNNKSAMLFVLIMVTLITLFALIAPRFNSGNIEYLDDLSASWTISVNGDEVYEGAITDYQFPRIHAGDQILISRALDQDILQDASLVVHAPFSRNEVYVDGELIQTYGEALPSGLVPTAVTQTTLPEHIAGTRLDVRIIPSIDNAFNNLEDFYIIPEGTLDKVLIMRAPQTLFISCTMILLGLLMVMVGLSGIRIYFLLFILGAVGIASGLWCLCCTKILQVFSKYYGFNTYAEYYSLYAVFAIFAVFFVMYLRKDKHAKVMWIASILFWLFIVMAVVGPIMGVVTLPTLLPIFQAFAALNALVFIVVYGISKHEKKKSEQLMLAACIIFFAYGVFDALRYNIEKHLMAYESNVGTTYLQYGLLIWIVLMMYSYLASINEKTQDTTEHEVWHKMAYTDALTSLSNRAFFQQCLDELADAQDEYTILNFDLNGLKTVNDRFGHINGDRFINAFAEILKQSFREGDIVARIGGDEFTVIAKDLSESERDEILGRLARLEKEKSEGKAVPLTAAYGYANSLEVEGKSPDAVYQLADSRMYAMKDQYYENSGLRRRK